MLLSVEKLPFTGGYLLAAISSRIPSSNLCLYFEIHNLFIKKNDHSLMVNLLIVFKLWTNFAKSLK